MIFSSEELEVFASETEVFMAILDVSGKVIKANDKWYKKLHITKDQFVGNSIYSFIHTEDRTELESSIENLAEDWQLCHQMVRFVATELKWYGLQIDLSYKEGHIYLVGFDVSEHYLEHTSLTEMTRMAKVGSWYHDPVRNQNFWSDECYRIHDMEVGLPMNADKALAFYLPEYRSQIDELIKRLYEHGESYDFSGEILTASGKKKWIRTQASPTFHEGKLIFIYGITADQTRLHNSIKKLEEEAETRELALKGIKSALFDYEVESDLMFVNPDFKEILGLPANQDRIKRAELVHFVHPADREKVRAKIEEDFSREEDHYHYNEYRLKLKNGEYNHFEVYGWRKKDVNGKTIRVVGNLINVHERVMVQQERTRIMNSLEAMINNGFIYSILLDLDGVILLADKKSLDVIRKEYNRDPMQEEVKYEDVMPELFKATFNEEFIKAKNGNTIRKEAERPLLEGAMQWLDIMYRPIRNENDEIVFVLTNGMDVTERKKALKTTLEAESRAIQLSDLKSKILSDLSHEIRTPLNGIMGINEILMKDCLDDEQRTLLITQKESSLRLLKTLTDMIVLSDQYAIKKGMNSVHLSTNKAIQTCYDMYLHMAKLKNLTFDIELPKEQSKIFVDRELFITSLGAIVNKALKHTHEGGVKIVAKNHKKNGNVTINVIDTGTGIDTKDFGKIFNDFDDKQAGLHKKYEASGIGLGAAKRYLESMGGSIRVASVLGKGSEFRIKMPSEI